MSFQTAYWSTININSSNTTSSALLNSSMDFGDFVLFWISIIVLLSGLFSIIYILWGGVLLILSWWKDDKIKPAINSIRYALIWLAVIVLSIFIFPKVAWLLWLDVTKYSQPDKIFNEIKIIWDKIFKTSSTQNYYNEIWEDSLWIDFSSL